MTNYEKYKDEIIKYSFFHETCKLKKEIMGINCGKTLCTDCRGLVEKWLEAEYVEHEVDWNKVPMGTPVRVWNNMDIKYEKTFIAYYENRICPFTTIDITTETIGKWKHAELIEVDNESNTND